MHKTIMFCPVEDKLRHGPMSNRRDAIKHLEEVEAFFQKEMDKYPTVYTFDCQAAEAYKFWTINYTSYAGFFQMNPLQPELTAIQMREAAMQCEKEDVDYVSYFADRVTGNKANKYSDIKEKSDHDIDVLVVLVGTNLWDRTIDINKVRKIVEAYGKRAAIKPHPLTNDQTLKDLKKALLPSALILDPHDDMYKYMRKAKKVYGTHSTEAVISAVCLGLPVEPIDQHKHRGMGSFNGINSLLFSSPDPKRIVNRMFNDYRSGMVNPLVQKDWKERVVAYLEYIHKVRDLMGDAYV